MKKLIPFFKPFIGLLITLLPLFFACGNLSYELLILGDPPFHNADIFLDDELVRSGVNDHTYIFVSYEKHEIKILQKGYKPFVTIIEPEKGQRSERALTVKLESLDLVLPTRSQSDTVKIVK